MAVGGYNTIFGIVLYTLALKIFGEKHYILLGFANNIIAITNSYFMQKFFVFKTKGNYLREYSKFLFVYLAGTLFFMLPLYVLVEWCHIRPVIANLFIVFIATFVTFIANNFFAFKTNKIESRENL